MLISKKYQKMSKTRAKGHENDFFNEKMTSVGKNVKNPKNEIAV